MKKKIPVLFIHGGMTFKNDKDYLTYLKEYKIVLDKPKKWREAYLQKGLGSQFQVIYPQMPQGSNAQYRDWKIWFEKYLALITTRPVLIGHSLGGIFLAKYLSENKLKHKALGVYLVAPPFTDEMGGFTLSKNLSLLPKNTESLHLFFSTNDTSVPVSHAEKYQKLLPETSITIFKNRGHFIAPTFPELVKLIKSEVVGKK